MIDGPEDLRKMLSAHEEQSTKICHLYLVNGSHGRIHPHPLNMDEDA